MKYSQETNGKHMPEYEVPGCKTTDDEMHFQVEAPKPIACESCRVTGEFVRFGKPDVPYRDLPIHGKRVTLWVIRRRYTCRTSQRNSTTGSIYQPSEGGIRLVG